MKIVHIEDHLMFAQGLKLLAERELTGIEWISRPTVKEALELIVNSNDVVLILLDLTLVDMSGISFLRTLRLKKIVLPVVLMTASVDLIEISEALDEGAMGFIPKSYSCEKALAAIKLSLLGQPFIPEEYKRELARLARLGRFGGEKRKKLARAHSLTNRQLEVLELMQHGLANIDIAEQLGVSDNAIKYHVKVLYRSFDVGNRVECIRYAENKGFI